MTARTRRLRRGCLPVLGAVLVVFLGLAFVVYRALDPASLRSLAETRLSAALGQKVTIGAIDIDWLPSPSVEAREIALGATAGKAPPSLALGSIRIVPRLSSLFSRPVVAERVELVGLVVHALRTKEGRWRLPFPALPPGGQAEEGASVEVGEVVLEDGRLIVFDEGRLGQGAGLPEPPSIRGIRATVRRQGSLTRLDNLAAAIGRSSLTGQGTVGREGLRLSLAWNQLRPGDLPEVFALAGMTAPAGVSIEGDKPLTLDVVIDPSGALTASGEIAAARATFQSLTLTSLRSPVRLASNQLTLDPVAFTAYKGSQRGRVTANLSAEPLAWSLDTRFEGVDLRQLVNATTTVPDSLSGTATLRGRLDGVVVEPMLDRATGTMAVAVSKGAVHNFPLVAAINSALRIAEGDTRDLRFESLTATLSIARGRATTDDLLLKSGELMVTAAGTLGFDRSLDFRGRVVFSAQKAAELVRAVKEASRLRNARGEIEVPVTVSGTVVEPRFAVDAAGLLRRGVQDELERRLRKGLQGIIK